MTDNLEERVDDLEATVRFQAGIIMDLLKKVSPESFNSLLAMQVVKNDGFPLKMYLPPGSG